MEAMLKDRELLLTVDSEQDISLELGLLKDKVEFFEEVFGIRLVFRRKSKSVKEDEHMDLKNFEKPEYFVNRS